MIFRRIKKTVKSIQKKQRNLEKEKQHQLESIEKMYANVEAKDAELQEREKKHAQFGSSFILRFWILGALVAYFGYILFKTLDIVYLILAAFIISMIMDAPISFLAKRMHRGFAIALAYLLVLWFMFLIVVVVLPFIVNQLTEVLKLGIDKINQFQDLLRTEWLQSVIKDHLSLPSSIKKYILDGVNNADFVSALQTNLQDNISQIVTTWSSYVTNLWWFAVKLVTGVFTTIAQWMILFVLSIFFSIEKENVINFISSLAWLRRNHMYVKLQKMYAKLGLRLKWQVLVCLYVGVMVMILFNLWSRIFGVKIPQIWTLSLIAWMMNFIPYIWPLIWMTIATLVTLVAWWWKAWLLVLVVYILVNQSENNVLTPIIMNKTLWVSALLIFICMLLGGLIFGFIGVLLAVPIAVILTMAFDKDGE
jgi:predicted PurR-regulated permease PerM